MHELLQSSAQDTGSHDHSAFSSAFTELFYAVSFNSTTVAAGTPVQFLFTAQLHDTLSPCFAPIQNFPGGTGGANVALNTNVGINIKDDSCAPLSESQRTASVILSSSVGSGLSFAIDLTGNAYAFAGGSAGPSSYGMVDASNTAAFALQVLTPGVTYSTDTNFVFPTSVAAVPEPASGLLVFLGAAAAWIVGRRREDSRLRL